MSASASNEIKAEPNLTPLLDVVFQLITFFMLVINFSSDNYDARIRLPIAATATAPETGPGLDEDRLVFNIDKDGNLLFNGEVMDTEKAIKEIRAQAAFVKSAAERSRKKKKAPPVKEGEEGSLPTTIVFRCDRETQFSNFYRLITACQSNGFRNFSLKAMNGEK